MPEIKEGPFELDLGLVKLGAKFSEEDLNALRDQISIDPVEVS
jgi:hypothetical protein